MIHPYKDILRQAETDLDAARDEIERLTVERDFFLSEVKLRNRIASTNDTAASLLRRAEKAEAEIARLTKERDTDHANINLKADFIEATINQLALAEAERDEARAQVAAAYEAAAEKCDVVFQDGVGDLIRGIGDEIRRLTPAHAKAALEAYGREKVREGMQRVIDRLRHEGQINPSLTYADAIEWAESAHGGAEMTQHDKAPELVERLKVVARCGTDSTMRHFAYASMAQDPDGDYVTYCAYAALSDENRRLREALEDIADIETRQAQVLLISRAALTSGGRRGRWIVAPSLFC